MVLQFRPICRRSANSSVCRISIHLFSFSKIYILKSALRHIDSLYSLETMKFISETFIPEWAGLVGGLPGDGGLIGGQRLVAEQLGEGGSELSCNVTLTNKQQRFMADQLRKGGLELSWNVRITNKLAKIHGRTAQRGRLGTLVQCHLNKHINKDSWQNSSNREAWNSGAMSP